MDSHFTGVSLGATVSGSRSWAHELEVSITDAGIAVSGPETQPSALPWSAVRHFAPGFTLAFPDGSPATELEVTLPDRSLSFLIPADQLPASGVAELVRFAVEQSKPTPDTPAATAAPAIPPPPPGSPTGSAVGSSSVPLGYSAPGPRPVAATTPQRGTYPEPVYKVATPTPPAKKKPRRRMLVGAGGVLVAAAIAVVVILAIGGSPASRVVATTRTTRPNKPKTTTTTTTPPKPLKELPGPPLSMSPTTALDSVIVHTTDLKGWQDIYPGGVEVPGAGAAISAETVGSPLTPSEAAVVEPSFEALQQCSGLPLDHLQLWDGNYYAGGPPTYASNTYEPPDVNASQAFTTPEIYSFASEVGTTSTQEQDMADMAAPSFTGCLQSFFLSYFRAIESQLNGNVDNLTVAKVAVSSEPGVETLEWVLNANTVYQGVTTPLRQHYVILGAGRLEQFLASVDSQDQPIASATWTHEIGLTQHRMQVVASKK
jgi:hypothetical protein